MTPSDYTEFNPLPTGISLTLIVEQSAASFGTHFVKCEDSTVFVKRGSPSLNEEARTQHWFYGQAVLNPNSPRVCKPYVVFGDGLGSTYFAMDAAPSEAKSLYGWVEAASGDAKAAREAAAIEMMTKAVNWMLALNPPPGDFVGPIGGGPIMNRFFNMEAAPLAFTSALALEKYINKALASLPGKTSRTVSLATEQRFYCPSDIKLRNFMWDGKEVWVIDFEHFNVVPRSMMRHCFDCTTNKIVKAVGKGLAHQRSEQTNLMVLASSVIIKAGMPTWGLNADGDPVA